MKSFLKIVLSCLFAVFFYNISVGATGEATPATFKNYEEPWLTRAPYEPTKVGDLRLVVDINEDGSIADWMVIRAHDEAFEDAIKRVIDEWEFNPAMMDGKPIPIVMEFMFHFSKRGTSLVEGNLTELYLQRLPNMHKEYVVVRSFKELDCLPEPVKIVKPMINPEIPLEERKGTVVVGFYIDQTGKVRIPIIEEYEGNREIIDAAYNAILQWEFKPPTIRGKPVVVRVEQPFEFNP